MYCGESAGKLSAEQIEKLESIGMDWKNRYDILWHSAYEEAKAYFTQNDNLDVPSTYVSGDKVQLGKWIIRQRDAYLKGELSKEKISLLNAIGMIWQKPNSWQLRYDIACQYYSEKGNLNIPQTVVVDGVWIGKWVSEQRKKKDKLSQEQIRMLDAIGMRW